MNFQRGPVGSPDLEPKKCIEDPDQMCRLKLAQADAISTNCSDRVSRPGGQFFGDRLSVRIDDHVDRPQPIVQDNQAPSAARTR